MSDSDKQLPTTAEALASYREESKRPLVCLAFLSPLLILYEVGVIAIGNGQTRNGADVLLRGVLDSVGFEFSLMLPIASCVILMSWHHLSGQPWKLRFPTLIGMACECIAFGLMLMIVAQLQHTFFDSDPAPNTQQSQVDTSKPLPNKADVPTEGSLLETSSSRPAATPSLSVGSESAQVVAYLGAGIYEEMLFRLMLLPIAILIARRFVENNTAAITIGILVSTFVFVMAHYEPLNASGYAIEFGTSEFWYGATFRLIAGVFFALLFLYRGFGVVVGAHAAYDLLICLD